MKRVSFLAALMLLISALTARAEIVASGQLDGDQSWTVTDDGTLTISGTGEVTANTVYTIFSNHDYLVRHIVFEEGITAISAYGYNWAVYNSVKLASVTFPSTMQSIGYLPCHNVSIAFFNAETPPQLDDSENIFMSLTSICTVVVPTGTKDKYCKSDWAKLSRWYEVGYFPIGIESLIVECTDIHAPIAVSVNVITPGTLAEEIAKTGYHADEINSIAVSGTFDDSDFAFLKDSMTSLLICDLTNLSVSSLPVAYFARTTLYRCLLPHTLTSISDSLFYWSYVKDGITVPSGVTNIGDYAFYSSDVLYGDYNQVIPSGLDSFGKSAFQRCIGLNGKATIPNGMPLVPDGAFFGCTSLTSITIPESVTEIGEAAFRGSGLKEVNIPESVNSIGASAFHDCASLTSITIPGSVTEIGGAAFRGSGLKEVNIPESVSSIGRSAFYDCDSLTHIFIPKGVTFEGNPLADYWDYEITELGKYPYLKTLIIKSDMNPEDARFDFTSADSLRVVEVQANMLNEYEDFGSTRLKIDSMTVSCGTLNNKGCVFLTLCRSTLRFIDLSKAENTELPDEALAECIRADSIVLPANLERIGCSTLRGCMALKSIDIPASVTEIDDNAFENCFSLLSINFGRTEGSPSEAGRAAAPAAQSELRRIGNWAFYNCHQLQHLVIPEGVTEIGDAAFYGCTYLEDLELPSTVTRIGDNCFALCSKLKQIRVRAAVPPEIEAKTFYDVNREIPVYVPEDYLDDYREDPYWREFNLIGEDHGGTVGIDHTSVDGLYRMEDGRIVLTEEMPVSVYTATGALIYSGTATEVPLPAPGVYLLRIGGETVKVVRP